MEEYLNLFVKMKDSLSFKVNGISAHYINANYQIFKNIQDPIEQETRKVRQSVQKKEVELDSPTSKGKSQTNKDCDQNKVTNTKLSYECEYCDKRFSVSFTTINIFTCKKLNNFYYMFNPFIKFI